MENLRVISAGPSEVFPDVPAAALLNYLNRRARGLRSRHFKPDHASYPASMALFGKLSRFKASMPTGGIDCHARMNVLPARVSRTRLT